MNNRTRKCLHWALWLAALPASFMMGCRLYEPPIYPRTAAPSAEVKHILFIGNSLTYYNDLPGLVQQLAANENVPLQVDSVTLFNADLETHWDITAARKRLEERPWDYVVLQEYSTKPADDPDGTLRDYKKWAGEIKRLDARHRTPPSTSASGKTPPTHVIIFENWTHKDQTGNAEKMRETYQKVQHEIGGAIAPIGDAWQRCFAEHPEITMFVDEKHPTVAGTYLTACVLYRTLYQKPATGLPTTLTGLKLAPDVAATLQKIADEVTITPKAAAAGGPTAPSRAAAAAVSP